MGWEETFQEIKRHRELRRLESTVDRYAAEMKAKLREKMLEGFSGWDDPRLLSYLEEGLEEHLKKQKRGGHEEIDLGNIAMMIWNIKKNQGEQGNSGH